jgi:predicted nucleic acid-binding Zn finger protein
MLGLATRILLMELTRVKESNPTTRNIVVPSNKADGREIRGFQISKNEGQVRRIDQATYRVLSQSGNGECIICPSEDEWRCECPDHFFRGVKCKHIWAVEFSLKMREQVRKNIVIEEVAIFKLPLLSFIKH